MPRPVRCIQSEGQTVPMERLQNVKVEKGSVPGAPVATADEAYILEIGPDGAKITAPGQFGEIWGRVTLDQLVRLSRDGRVPCGRIVDWPRLKWRGFMLDTVRNYLPPQGVKDVIDVMSRYKLNLFHWHLTENYAWRLESKRFPQLQSERAFLHRHKGKFYTQDEFREIVDYAYARGVRVMPEFDFPGHALAFRRAFGFKTMSDPGVAETAAALFEELSTLAPKEKMPFVHMGTDEVWKRDVEGSPRETLERMAKAIADGGRTMVSWVPGETYGSPGPRINMLWTNKVSPDKNPGAYFDAIGMYIEDFDPFELLSVAVYHKAARWHDAGDLNQGAIFCAWHDGFAGLPYENLLRNQPVFPSCVLFGDAYWRGRDDDLPQFRKRLPRGGDPLLAEAADIERRVVAQRDRALRDLKHPFHFLRQTDMRWRLSQADGTLIATDIAQATISPGREGCGVTNGTVVAETWIKSPNDQAVGAWIGFTNISRDHGLVYSAPLPDVGEWNRFGASVELNGEKIAPPKWKRPGLKKGNPIEDWTPAWTLYEADEEPFADQEYVMREPTPIRLRKGWNHVKLTLPNPSSNGKTKHRWVGTFIPVSGTTDHPREVEGLEYASELPPSEGPLSPGGWNPVVRERLNALIERNRGNPDAYAVFDFDYTTAIGDLSYVCMWELLENFDIKVDDFHALIAEGMDKKYMDDIDEIGRLAAKLKPLAGQNLVDNPVWREFSGKYWAFYRRLYLDVGDYDAYLWRSRVFTGYTPQELRDLTRRGMANVMARGCLWRDPTAPTEKRGIVLTPEIKELFRELRKAGIAIYIVSGSFQAALAVATGPEFGLGLDQNCVFGAEFEKDAFGRYLPVMKEGCVKSGEKPTFIRSVIAPRHHGADPILTAGDSMGDYKMLVEFKDLQLALLFFRKWRQPEMYELALRGGCVVVQGRDETRGCYIPELWCVEPQPAVCPAPCGHAVAKCAVPRQAPSMLSFHERLAAKADAPFLIAHRGCQSLAPENTVASFVSAARLGLDAIETDVRLSKDGVLVCAHDASLKRMFGVKKKISDLTADELREFVPTNGNCIAAWPKEMLRIPTFAEYLDVCEKYDKVPFVETKGDVAVVKPVIEELRRRGLLRVAVLSAISFDHIREARRLDKEIFVHHIFSEPALLDELSAMGNAGLSYNYKDLATVPDGLVERVHAKGVKMCLRAGDTPDTVAKMMAMGLDYIPTNVTVPLR